MPRDAHDWDLFWTGDAAPTPSADADTWYDVVWRYWLERWHERFASRPGRRMLECGCGAGRVSLYMASRGFECTLVDYSERALDQARIRFAECGLSAQFVRADVRQLGLADGQYDVVYSGGVLEFFDEIDQPIAEMTRVLAPGGLFGANLVPLKFSAQTMADLERTVVYGMRNLVQGRWRDAFKRVQMASTAAGIRPWTLVDLERASAAAGLKEFVGRAANPFPQLALPRFLHRRYARLMRSHTAGWRRFDDSLSTWNRIWGIGYSIVATKATLV